MGVDYHDVMAPSAAEYSSLNYTRTEEYQPVAVPTLAMYEDIDNTAAARTTSVPYVEPCAAQPELYDTIKLDGSPVGGNESDL